jgi:hypothetical protein
MKTVLLLLAVAACPLMMVWCRRSMGGRAKADAKTTAGAADEAARLRQEIAELREEISRRRSHLAVPHAGIQGQA